MCNYLIDDTIQETEQSKGTLEDNLNDAYFRYAGDTYNLSLLHL